MDSHYDMTYYVTSDTHTAPNGHSSVQAPSGQAPPGLAQTPPLPPRQCYLQFPAAPPHPPSPPSPDLVVQDPMTSSY